MMEEHTFPWTMASGEVTAYYCGVYAIVSEPSEKITTEYIEAGTLASRFFEHILLGPVVEVRNISSAEEYQALLEKCRVLYLRLYGDDAGLVPAIIKHAAAGEVNMVRQIFRQFANAEWASGIMLFFDIADMRPFLSMIISDAAETADVAHRISWSKLENGKKIWYQSE